MAERSKVPTSPASAGFRLALICGCIAITLISVRGRDWNWDVVGYTACVLSDDQDTATLHRDTWAALTKTLPAVTVRRLASAAPVHAYRAAVAGDPLVLAALVDARFYAPMAAIAFTVGRARHNFRPKIPPGAPA